MGQCVLSVGLTRPVSTLRAEAEGPGGFGGVLCGSVSSVGGVGGSKREASCCSWAVSDRAKGAKAEPGDGCWRACRISRRQALITSVESATGMGMEWGNHARVSLIRSELVAQM